MQNWKDTDLPVAKNIDYSILQFDFPEEFIENEINIAAIKLSQRMAITLFSVYAPPNHKVTPDIYFLIRHPLIILGDFNGHHTSWGLFNDLKGKHLFYFIEETILCS